MICDDTKYDAAKQINLLELTSVWPIKNIKTLYIGDSGCLPF